MANADLKTKKTQASVSKFIDSIADEKRREDCRRVVDIMKKATDAEPKMWGSSVVGFGDYHYKYESGRENDWFVTGFSPRKDSLTLYFMTGIEPYKQALEAQGKKFTIYVYEGARHGYTMPDLSVYNEAAAERHWRELIALFDSALK